VECPFPQVPAKTRAFVWERHIAIHLTQFMCPLLCTSYRQKPEINIYYTSGMLYFLKRFPYSSFRISVEIEWLKNLQFWSVLASVYLLNELDRQYIKESSQVLCPDLAPSTASRNGQKSENLLIE